MAVLGREAIQQGSVTITPFVPDRVGLIQSVSQVPWPGLPAWGEVGGIASPPFPKPLLLQTIST